MRLIDADALKEETGTKALPITYEEVKEFSANLFALLDDLKGGAE